MASPTWWTWVWASSGRWWWTEKPGILQSMGSQRVGHDWATELNWAIRGASFCQSVCSLCPENCVCVCGGRIKRPKETRNCHLNVEWGDILIYKKGGFLLANDLHLATLNSYLPLMNHRGCIQTLFHHVLETSMWMTHQAWFSTPSVSPCRMNSMTWAMPYSQGSNLQIHLGPLVHPRIRKTITKRTFVLGHIAILKPKMFTWHVQYHLLEERLPMLIPYIRYRSQTLDREMVQKQFI